MLDVLFALPQLLDVQEILGPAGSQFIGPQRPQVFQNVPGRAELHHLRRV